MNGALYDVLFLLNGVALLGALLLTGYRYVRRTGKPGWEKATFGTPQDRTYWVTCLVTVALFLWLGTGSWLERIGPVFVAWLGASATGYLLRVRHWAGVSTLRGWILGVPVLR